MMLICNRFAFVPVTCYKCKLYVWMEPYRRQEVWTGYKYVKAAICRKCIANHIKRS